MSTKQALRQIDYDNLRAIAGSVQLDDIRLLDCRFSALIEPDGLDAEETLSFVRTLRGARWSLVMDGKALVTSLAFRVRGQAQKRTDVGHSATARDVFVLESSWKCRYHFLREVPFGDLDLLDDFAFANGQLNVFPYFRQLVSDITARSGWPAVILPVFRAPSRRPWGSVTRE